VIDTLLSDLHECASMGTRAFRTRRQLRRDARKDLPSAYDLTPRDVVLRFVAGLLLVAAVGVLLTGCGGGDIEDEQPKKERRPDSLCWWDPREQPVVYHCQAGAD
jgi:hypothetical protein